MFLGGFNDIIAVCCFKRSLYMVYVLFCIEWIQIILIYFILDNFHQKKKINYFILLMISLLMCGITLRFPPYVDHLILFVLLSYLSITINKDKNIGFSLSIVTLASSIPLLTNYCVNILFEILMSPQYDLFNTSILSVYLISHIILAIFFALFFKKIINHTLPKIKNEKIIGYLASIIYLIFIVYDLFIYIDEMPNDSKLEIIINMMLTFIFILFFISATVVSSISRNKQLIFDKKQKDFEYTAMEKYTDELNKQYHEIRKFRHDYINILSSMEHYIQEKKLDQLEYYYYQNILPTKKIFEKNNLHLNDIQKIKSNEIKSILMTKLVIAQEKNLTVQVEVRDVVTLPKIIDSIIFIRILGILLDNAIEELETLSDGELRIAIFYQEKDLVFVVQNTCHSHISPIHQLKKEGYSTKGDNRGIGLKNIDDLIRESEHILLETTIKNNQFTQIIRIIEGDK